MNSPPWRSRATTGKYTREVHSRTFSLDQHKVARQPCAALPQGVRDLVDVALHVLRVRLHLLA